MSNTETQVLTPSTAATVPPWRVPAGKVLLVLPAFNEEAGLGSLLASVDQTLYDARIGYEVIVVDDGSTDDTLRVANEYAAHMPIIIEAHERNQGLGAAIRDGLGIAARRAGERDIAIVMDADNSHTPGLILSMVRSIQEGADVVIASRYCDGAVVRGVPFNRLLLSWCARLVLQLLFPTRGVRDYTCGYRAYRSSALRRAFDRYGDGFVKEDGFQCMVDVLLKLRQMDAVFREVPLILRYDLKGGVSKMQILKTIRRTVALVLRRRFGA